MKNIPVYDMKGKSAGKFSLDEAFFNGKVNKAFLHRVVLMYLANLRQGCASTKRRDQVRGGGRKPWRQKGTGRARAGSIRSPLWKGGGSVFGPLPRDYSYSLPKNTGSLALAQSLNSKIRDNELLLVESISVAKPKTKEFTAFLAVLKVKQKALVVIEKYNPDILRAAQNVRHVTVKAFNNINAWDVLRHKKIIFSKQALENLVKLRKR